MCMTRSHSLKQDLQNICFVLNNFHPMIKFNSEMETESKLAFLDILLHRDVHNIHSVKGVHIRSYSVPYFPAFGLNTEKCSVRIRENTDQNNSEYGQFSRSDYNNCLQKNDVYLNWYSLCPTKFKRGTFSKLKVSKLVYQVIIIYVGNQTHHSNH